MSTKTFKTHIPRNRCVQVICTKPQNIFNWNHKNSQLCGTERVFPQYDFVTVLRKNTKWRSWSIENLFHRRDNLNGHVNTQTNNTGWQMIHTHIQRTHWQMNEITSVTCPNVLVYIIRTPWVGSLLSWTPSIKTTLKNLVTTHAQLQ